MKWLTAKLQLTLAERDPSVDFLRGLAIFSVIALHFAMIYSSAEPDNPRFFSLFFWRPLSRNGYLGVSTFFVISGYLITKGALIRWGSLKQLPLFNFYVLRFARIVPPLLMLAAAYITLFFLDEPTFPINLEKVTTGELLFGILTLRIWQYPVCGFAIGVLWSMSLEETFYVAFPLVVRLLRLPWLIALFLVGSIVYAIYYRSVAGQYNAFFTFFGIFDLLSLGCLLALFRKYYPLLAQRFEHKGLHRLALLCVLSVYLYSHDIDHFIIHPSLMGAAAAMFILTSDSASSASVYQGWFATLIRLMGIYSYEIYLSHIIVGQLMKVYIFDSLHEFPVFNGAIDVFFLMYWASVTLVSVVFHHYYSEPTRHWIKRIARSK